MQRFLNQHIYDLEICDCKQEGIETIDINYTDNHLVIETFLNVNIFKKKRKNFHFFI
jgi:myosin heavy subunit